MRSRKSACFSAGAALGASGYPRNVGRCRRRLDDQAATRLRSFSVRLHADGEHAQRRGAGQRRIHALQRV
jgi:hypothetical protein